MVKKNIWFCEKCQLSFKEAVIYCVILNNFLLLHISLYSLLCEVSYFDILIEGSQDHIAIVGYMSKTRYNRTSHRLMDHPYRFFGRCLLECFGLCLH